MAEYTSTVPATEVYAITPSDGSDLTKSARSLYIAVGGDIKFTTIKDITITLPVPSNFYLLAQVKKVWATDTTATGIFSLI